jgi:DNA-binding IclR family transcriptional regulator
LASRVIEEQSRTSAVGKAFAILRVLRQAPVPLSLTAVAEQVNIAPSSAHAVLTQLLREDAVIQDADKRYQLGPSVFHIGSSFARGARIYRSIWMELVQASNELGVTAVVAVEWEGHYLVLNSHRGGDSDIAVPFGGRVPLDGGSFGKVHFAWSGAELPAQLPEYTKASVTDVSEYRSGLESARRLGYATDEGEFAEGTGGVAAPVTSSLGYEGLASFLMPLARLHEIGIDQLGQRIAGLASRASMALGDNDRVRFFGFE